MDFDLLRLITLLEQAHENPFCRYARTDTLVQAGWRREVDSIVGRAVRAGKRPGVLRPPTIEEIRELRCLLEADHRFADGPLLIGCLETAAELVEHLPPRDNYEARRRNSSTAA